MFGPVVTTEAHLACSGGGTHTNNTAEMTAMIEALSLLGPHGPVARDEQSCIYFDSLHAAGVKTTPQDHFRSVNLNKEFAYRSEREEIGTATTIELVTRSAERKSQQRVK